MDTQKEVIKEIAQYLGLAPNDLDGHALLQEDLNLSPVELNDLIAHLSATFDVILPTEELSEVKQAYPARGIKEKTKYQEALSFECFHRKIEAERFFHPFKNPCTSIRCGSVLLARNCNMRSESLNVKSGI